MRVRSWRAWHRKRQRMYKVESVSWKTLSSGKQVLAAEASLDDIDIQDEPFEDHIVGETCDLMDYIGLTDRHGISIYEEDILLCKCRTSEEYKPRFLVEELNGCFMIGTCTTHEFYRLFESMPEILGNRFQHPELCK